MNCQTCGYALWNLARRTCPECDTPFKPSDFDFRPQAVAFRCPHCSQPYYGTDARGHLVPRAFDCASCGRPIDMDEMVVEPRAISAIEQGRATRLTNPWVQRRRLGRVRSWGQAVWAALVRPSQMMRAGPGTRRVRDALAFLVVTSVLYTFTGFAPVLVVFGWIGVSFDVLGTSLAVAAGFTALILVALIGGAALWAVSVHGAMKATGPTRGWGVTFEAVSYGSAANVLSAIPCLALWIGWIGWIWWAVATSLMLIEGHAAKPWRAIVAVFAMPTVLTLGSLALLGVEWQVTNTVAPGIQQQQQPTPPLTPPGAALQIIGDDLFAWSIRRDGKGPDHAARLVLDSGLSLGTLALPSGKSDPSQFPIVNLSPGQWDSLSRAERRDAIERFVAGRREDVVAHRLGDVVFTYHGLPLGVSHSPLWAAIGYPDPRQNPNWGPGDDVVVLYADRRIDRIPFDRFPEALAAQNALRAEENLPPLPDPATVAPED